MSTRKIINYILEQKSDLAKTLIEKILYERANDFISRIERKVEKNISYRIQNRMNDIFFPVFEEEEKK